MFLDDVHHFQRLCKKVIVACLSSLACRTPSVPEMPAGVAADCATGGSRGITWRSSPHSIPIKMASSSLLTCVSLCTGENKTIPLPFPRGLRPGIFHLGLRIVDLRKQKCFRLGQNAMSDLVPTIDLYFHFRYIGLHWIRNALGIHGPMHAKTRWRE